MKGPLTDAEEYFGVDYQIGREIVKNDLPVMKKEFERISLALGSYLLGSQL